MKNFKLLLATTAILSTGALIANAETVPLGTNISINPSVNIIAPLSASSIQELKFGTLISPKAGDTVILEIDGTKATGKATLLTETIADGTDLQRGIISMPSQQIIVGVENGSIGNYAFNFPNGLQLKNGDNVCGTVTFQLNETPVTEGSGFTGTTKYYYGGTFEVTQNNLPQGTCTNTGTVTIIATGTAISESVTPND